MVNNVIEAITEPVTELVEANESVVCNVARADGDEPDLKASWRIQALLAREDRLALVLAGVERCVAGHRGRDEGVQVGDVAGPILLLVLLRQLEVVTFFARDCPKEAAKEQPVGVECHSEPKGRNDVDDEHLIEGGFACEHTELLPVNVLDSLACHLDSFSITIFNINKRIINLS